MYEYVVCVCDETKTLWVCMCVWPALHFFHTLV